MIIDCPHCKTKHVQTSSIWNGNEDSRLNKNFESWRVVQCQNPLCKKFVLIRNTLSGNYIGLFPTISHKLPADLNIPNEICDEYEEAGKCLNNSCYKASMVMSRRALQRLLKLQGCEQHKLVDQIKTAKDQNILRPAFHEIAEEIRKFGNLSAHPDDDQLDNANFQNASDILGFVRLLVEDFYEIPARVNLLKKRREGNA